MKAWNSYKAALICRLLFALHSDENSFWSLTQFLPPPPPLFFPFFTLLVLHFDKSFSFHCTQCVYNDCWRAPTAKHIYVRVCSMCTNKKKMCKIVVTFVVHKIEMTKRQELVFGFVIYIRSLYVLYTHVCVCVCERAQYLCNAYTDKIFVSFVWYIITHFKCLKGFWNWADAEMGKEYSQQ